MKPVPAGSKMDPLLPKAKPVSDGGSASVKTCLRRGKKDPIKGQSGERSEKETTLQTPRSVKKEGGGGAQDAGAESLPLQLVMKTTVRQVVPL